MAVVRPKIAINNAVIPALSSQAQRAVVNAALDAAPRTPRVFMGADDSADYNMASVIYAENVMPAAHGIKSVGFIDVASPNVGGDFDTIFPLRDADENAVLFCPAHGGNFVFDSELGTWTGESIADIWGLTPDAGDIATARVTYAYVDGKTFVCYSRLKNGTTDMSIMQWDSATKSLIPATPLILNLPYAAGEIDGIASSNGYLLVWSGLSIAWSFFSGTAFDYDVYTNGSYTGSGNQIPEDIQGVITAIVGLPGGFVAFTARNAISASYHAQTISAPWVFKEIADCGGLESYEQATVEGSLGKITAYTSAGVQSITLNSSEHVHPGLADFITGREVESYDFATHQLQKGALGADAFIKMTAVGNRYVVLSYGYLPGVYSYALVYDVALERWGKLRLLHRDCFSYTYQQGNGGITYAALLDVTYSALGDTSYEDLSNIPSVITPAQRALAFMTEGGGIKLASWAARDDLDPAVAIVGRIQIARSKDMQLNRVELDGFKQGDVFIQASNNGRTIAGLWDTVTVEQADDYRVVGCMVDCKNFNVVLEGSFSLSSLIVEGIPAGEF
jgi:hypothetical protein